MACRTIHHLDPFRWFSQLAEAPPVKKFPIALILPNGNKFWPIGPSHNTSPSEMLSSPQQSRGAQGTTSPTWDLNFSMKLHWVASSPLLVAGWEALPLSRRTSPPMMEIPFASANNTPSNRFPSYSINKISHDSPINQLRLYTVIQLYPCLNGLLPRILGCEPFCC